uniref:Guanine nucleotide-binding protein subunit beta-like protein n=1 Tax=Palpitomonas bilix TaxID=652834 RepID=A0A7S3DAN8_9EUKA|mmetsp:Transcript_29341/g.75642  ORF Transcript_29341/g.75642 Transcript_29341/m.75642 type:complete len:897 (+) Transcript_29341:226-2916(+)|eukprot:CAMPEP_0113897826 /NCGR_PEP_ID=MMETSP0780_2-20120614/18959_1 /TAXON_ID=652834 /ORGANISM="Palpitomonas bilix" /LENGTH=896 /DNA_ID=CAMNT_0000889461 /DNA_START=156 /DNA_END=2846 /DNA_ORIENTATION=+ /assembly_acc=CAM_ASM_000599
MSMEIRRIINDVHASNILCVAYNPARREIFTGSQEAIIKVWDGQSGELVRSLQKHSGCVTCLQYCNETRLLFSGSIDGHVYVWKDGKNDIANDIDTEGPVYCLEWNKKRDHLIVGGKNRVRIFEIARNNKQVLQTESIFQSSHHSDFVQGIVCNQVGKIYTTSYDKKIGILEPDTNQPYKFSNVRLAHKKAISAVAFDHDDNWLITGSYDRTVKLWAKDSDRALLTFDNFEDTITGLCYVPSTSNLWVASNGSIPQIFDPRTGADITDFKRSMPLATSSAAVASAFVGGTSPSSDQVRLTSTTSGTVAIAPGSGLGGEDGKAWRVQKLFSMNDTKEVIGTTNLRQLIIWRYNPCAATAILKGHNDWVELLCYSPVRPMQVFSLGADSLILRWESTSQLFAHLYTLQEQIPVPKDLVLPPGVVPGQEGVPFDDDEDSDEEEEDARDIFDFNRLRDEMKKELEGNGVRKEMKKGRVRGTILCGAFNEEGDVLVTGADTGIVRVWNILSDSEKMELTEPCKFILREHTDRVVALIVVKHILVTASWDCSLRFWDLNTGTLWISVMNAHDDILHDMCYCEERDEFVTVSADKRGYVRSFDSREIVAEFVNPTDSEILLVKWSEKAKLWITAADDHFIRAYPPTCDGRKALPMPPGLKLRQHKPSADGIAQLPCVKFMPVLGEVVTAMEVDQERGYLFVATVDKILRVVDLDKEEILQTHIGHADTIRHILHLPQQNQILTASWDTTIRVWIADPEKARREAGEDEQQEEEGGKGKSFEAVSSQPRAVLKPLSTQLPAYDFSRHEASSSTHEKESKKKRKQQKEEELKQKKERMPLAQSLKDIELEYPTLRGSGGMGGGMPGTSGLRPSAKDRKESVMSSVSFARPSMKTPSTPTSGGAHR